MTIAHITKKILQNAEDEARVIEETARDTYEKRLAKAHRKIAKTRETEKARIHAEAEREKERIIQSADLEFRKNTLAMKQQVISDSFDAALKEVVNKDDHEYREIIRRLMLKSVEMGDEEVIINEHDSARITADFITAINAELKKQGKKGELQYSHEKGTFTGGFILRRGKIEINATFKKIMNRNRDILEPEINKILFG